MNIPKIRCQIFLDASALNTVNKYGTAKNYRTISITIEQIIKEWKEYKTIAFQMREERDAKIFEKAKVLKE